MTDEEQLRMRVDQLETKLAERIREVNRLNDELRQANARADEAEAAASGMEDFACVKMQSSWELRAERDRLRAALEECLELARDGISRERVPSRQCPRIFAVATTALCLSAPAEPPKVRDESVPPPGTVTREQVDGTARELAKVFCCALANGIDQCPVHGHQQGVGDLVTREQVEREIADWLCRAWEDDRLEADTTYEYLADIIRTGAYRKPQVPEAAAPKEPPATAPEDFERPALPEGWWQESDGVLRNKRIHVRITDGGNYVRVYQDASLVSNVPVEVLHVLLGAAPSLRSGDEGALPGWAIHDDALWTVNGEDCRPQETRAAWIDRTRADGRVHISELFTHGIDLANMRALLGAPGPDPRVAELYRETLQKVSDIRDSIIGAQKVNWSEHIYPLVAALKAAGFEGAGYDIAHKNLGTLLERIADLERRIERAVAELQKYEIACKVAQCGFDFRVERALAALRGEGAP